MKAKTNYAEQERQDLLEHASRTLAAAIPSLPGSRGMADACIYLLKHLSQEPAMSFVRRA